MTLAETDVYRCFAKKSSKYLRALKHTKIAWKAVENLLYKGNTVEIFRERKLVLLFLFYKLHINTIPSTASSTAAKAVLTKFS